MAFFIFAHDEGIAFTVDHIRQWLRTRSDVVSIHESSDRFAAIRWSVKREGIRFECTLAIDGTAIWADYDVEAACEHLVDLAADLPVPVDLCDEEYASHIHLHDRAGYETPWSELVRMWSEAEGGE